jgi:hypothetical protein
MPVIHCFSRPFRRAIELGNAVVMPNFRDPKVAILSLLVVFLSALIWTNPPPASASQSQQITLLKLAEKAPTFKSPLWLTPLNENLEVIRPFLRPSSDWGAGHRGVDIVADADSMVLSPHSSTIGFANLAFGVPTVVLDHDDGSSEVFQPVCLVESAGLGQKLDAGELFGAFCSNESNDGHCGQLGCIHWSYRLDKDTYINPLRMVEILQPAKLLPLGVVDSASAV